MSAVQGEFHLARGNFRLAARFTLPARGISCVFGPSGCGKTTLLRCVAGLERAPEAMLKVHEQVWQDTRKGVFLPTHRRELGYVFQEARLFEHLNVERNLRFGWARVAQQMQRMRWEEVVEWLSLGPLLARRIADLSGGEKQRVAIGRALLASPRLLLLDEPLAALDAGAKAEILPYLERLHAMLAIPVIYVTHAIDEVLRIADYLLLMEAGTVVAQGTLGELVGRQDLPLAYLDEIGTVIEARVAEHDADFHLSYCDFSGGRLSVNRMDAALGYPVRLLLRARDVSLSLVRPEQTSILNILEGRVSELLPRGAAQVLVKLELPGGIPLLARITGKSAHKLGLRPGLQVYAQVKSVSLVR
ncbi:MAG: molybdenum ABC transporter ATP-binding protein [Burkholderiales bacterium]